MAIVSLGQLVKGKGSAVIRHFFQKRREIAPPLTCFEQALRMVQIKVSSEPLLFGNPWWFFSSKKVSVKKNPGFSPCGFRASDWGLQDSGSRSWLKSSSDPKAQGLEVSNLDGAEHF